MDKEFSQLSSALNDDIGFFQGGGESGACLRGVAWDRTPVGPPTSWPRSLKNAIRLMLDCPSAMSIAWGPHFIQFFNDACIPMIGCHRFRAAMGARVCEAFPETWPLIEPAFLAALRGESFYQEDLQMPVERNGKRENGYFTLSCSPLRDDHGNVNGVFSVTAETTLKKAEFDRIEQAQKKIEESEARLRIAIEAANMGTWDINPRNRQVEWSERTKELFGVPGIETIDLGMARLLIHPADRDRGASAISAALDPKGQGDYDIDYRILLGTGEIRWVSALGKTYFVETALGRKADRFSGTILDVTEKALAQEELQKAKAAAEAANGAKSAFLANMSHEIRTPLGAILGFTDLLRDSKIDASERDQYLDIISRNGKALTRVIDDILDLSKVEAGRMEIQKTRFSLRHLLGEIKDLFSESARLKAIDLKFTIGDDVVDTVSSDPARLRQILINIVGNAVKFTARGGVQVVTSMRVSTVGRKFITISVKDSGAGLSEIQRENLFHPFAQADNSTTRKFGGTGLGLVLSRRLAQALGGDVVIEQSAVLVGSTFVISFEPGEIRFNTSRTFSDKPTPSPLPLAGRLVGKKVLLVEDSKDNQALIRLLLSKHGAIVELAGDGLEGVQKAMQNQFNVILMDIQMPRMDGYEAIRELRKLGYVKPVFALTAHAMEEERKKTKEAGFNGHLTKPIDAGLLVQTIETQF